MSNFKRILARKEIARLADEKYKKVKIDNGEIKVDHHQHELSIQAVLNAFFEDGLHQTIIEEHENIIPELQGHPILIKEDLRKNIKNVNRGLIRELIKEYPELDEDTIVNTFLDTFIQKYDLIGNENTKLYNLIFDLNEKVAVFTISKNNIKKVKFQVLDLENYSNNIMTFIKEKKLIYKGKTEYIDFAQYFGGIPFYGIEVKTPKAGLISALKDIKTKSTYGFFIGLIGTEGTDTFITSSNKTKQYFLWKNYGNNNEITDIGILDFAKEILFQKNQALFYADKCIFVVTENKNKYLKNLRVQQYFVTKKVDTDFKKAIEDRKNDKYEAYYRYIKHHTRTGKSLTFKSISNLVFSSTEYKKLFNKIIFFTHDVASVLKSVIKEYGIQTFDGKEIEVIDSKASYKKMVENHNIGGMYIVNLQKIDTSVKKIDTNFSVLILIDEVHTHQKGILAKLREKHFPNASIISATATPIMKRVDKKIIKKNYYKTYGEYPTDEQIQEIYDNTIEDATSIMMNSEKLDELTPSEAEDLQLIVKLQTRKIKYDINTINKFESIEKESEKVILNEFLKEEILESKMLKSINKIKEVLEKESQHQLKDKKLLSEIEIFLNLDIADIKNYLEKPISSQVEGIYLKMLLEELAHLFNKFLNKRKSQVKKQLKRDFKLGMFDTKLKIITEEIQAIREELSGIYNPKSFWVVGSIIEAYKIMIKLKQKIQSEINSGQPTQIKTDAGMITNYDVTQNVYKNIRFAVDVSDYNNMDEEDAAELKKLLNNENAQAREINGKIIFTQNQQDQADIIEDFESEDEGCVDVLLLVKKRMMGYDNQELTIVFLDKSIKDVKEMMQISTRSTTKRFGKKAGYMIDMTIDNQNIETFKNTYALYDKADFDQVVISEDYLNEVYTNIESNLEEIKSQFTNNKPLDENNIHWYSNELIIKYNKGLQKSTTGKVGMEYFTLIKQLNENMKALINPKYQMKKDNKMNLYYQYETILDITAYLYKHIQNKESALSSQEQQILYTNYDIKNLIEEIFQSFNKNIDKSIKKIEDLITITGYSKEDVIISEDDRKVITSLNHEKIYKQIISLKRDKVIADTEIFKYFESLSDDIDGRTLSDEEYKKLTSQIDNTFNKVKDDIENKYNGITEYYIVSTHLQSFFKEDFKLNPKDAFEMVINKIATYITNNIMSSIEKHQDLKDEELINKIIEELNITSMEFLIEDIDVSSFEKYKNNKPVVYISNALENNIINALDDTQWLFNEQGYERLYNSNKINNTELYTIIQRIISKDEHYGI